MPTCRECNDEVTKLVSVKVGGKARKVCADCADRLREEGEVAEASEGLIQGMMGLQGPPLTARGPAGTMSMKTTALSEYRADNRMTSDELAAHG